MHRICIYLYVCASHPVHTLNRPFPFHIARRHVCTFSPKSAHSIPPNPRGKDDWGNKNHRINRTLFFFFLGHAQLVVFEKKKLPVWTRHALTFALSYCLLSGEVPVAFLFGRIHYIFGAEISMDLSSVWLCAFFWPQKLLPRADGSSKLQSPLGVPFLWRESF